MATSVPSMASHIGETSLFVRKPDAIKKDLAKCWDRRSKARTEISKLSAGVVNDTREIDRLLGELSQANQEIARAELAATFGVSGP